MRFETGLGGNRGPFFYVREFQSIADQLSGGCATAYSSSAWVTGFYSLRQARGPLPLVVSYTGYQSFTADLNLRQDTVINIRLKPVIALDEDCPPDN